VDTQSIKARPCFLCSQNRPPQQKGLAFKSDYLILVNPFPIFPKHLTIPSIHHTPQQIQGHFEDMLELAKQLKDYLVFYNGPKSGASAPDHFHFQAGNKAFLPVEDDFHNLLLCNLTKRKDEVDIFNWDHYLRTAITLNSDRKDKLILIFEKLYNGLKQMQPEETEPMLNILCSYENGKWIVHVFPRKLHRPRQYFLEGPEQLLLSPASIDMGGVLTIPREEDFQKITKEDVADIFDQVSFRSSEIRKLLENIF
jgi:ATP adenylyltransferase/5',5'''-P-1,P-4-tetraphosphate phosphorylase II